MTDFSVVGESPTRPDMPGKVSGRAQYAGDLSLPGMLHAKTKRSNVAHARIKRIDTSRALAYEGVKAVLTHNDVPRVLHYGSPHPRSASVTRDQYILDSKVRYWGESVAVVAAISEEIAEEALDLIEVEYEELPAAFTMEQALAPGFPPIHERENNLVVDPVLVKRGDVERGFREADLIVEGVYEMGRPTPAYMEPNVCVSQWNEDRLTMWISTQTPFMVRGILAEVLGLPLTKVRVIVDHMGGGFGAKQDLFQSEFLCALLAKKTGRPVRMEFTRKETFLGGRSRHPGTVWLKQGFKKDGTITARQARVTFNSGAYGSHAPGVTAVGTAALTSLFRCENVLLEGKAVYQHADRRRVPRLRRGADLLRARHPDGRGRGAPRHGSRGAQAQERGARGRPLAFRPSGRRTRLGRLHPARHAGNELAKKEEPWPRRCSPRLGYGLRDARVERLSRYQGAGQRDRAHER